MAFSEELFVCANDSDTYRVWSTWCGESGGWAYELADEEDRRIHIISSSTSLSFSERDPGSNTNFCIVKVKNNICAKTIVL